MPRHLGSRSAHGTLILLAWSITLLMGFISCGPSKHICSNFRREEECSLMSDETTSGEVETQSQGKTLAQIGAETIGTVLRNALSAAGVDEAVGFSIVLKNGATHEILSDTHPALDEPATEMQSFKIKQSAEG